MSYSFANLDEAWKQPSAKYGRKSRRITPSPSNDTIVFSEDGRSSRESFTPSPSFDSFQSSQSFTPSPSSQSFTPSPSPSPEISRPMMNPRGYGGIVSGGIGAPVEALDRDDFITMSLPGSLPGAQPGTSSMGSRIVPGSNTVSAASLVTPPASNKEDKILRHVLRIQDDVREMLKNGGSSTESSSSTGFPFVETGLFISVGLFVLLSMNMMLKMGKQHITYRFNLSD